MRVVGVIDLKAGGAVHAVRGERERYRPLDLARVGSGRGPDVAAIAEIHAAFPELELLAGGGVRDAADLRALVGTALHHGVKLR